MNCKTPDGKEYCYARKIYKRFNPYPALLEDNRLDLNFFELEKPIKLHPQKKPKDWPLRIFTCSTIELFHPSIPKWWRDEIFKIIRILNCFTFIILTKLPQNIDRSMPDNVWLGTTITWGERRDIPLQRTKARIKFICFEPLFDIPAEMIPEIIDEELRWVIVGRLTGHGKKYDPSREGIERIVDAAKSCSVPVFLKNNLREIWGESLIQEWPR
jgi:protein gp37